MRKFILSMGALALMFVLLPQQSYAFCTDNIPSKYKDSIQALYEDGILKGNKDGSCKPNEKINRIEFAVLTMRAALGDDDAQDAQCKGGLFSDLNCSAWYGKYAAKAKELGIFTKSNLNATKNVNMAEAAAIVTRTMFGTENEYSALEAKGGEQWYNPFFRLFKANEVPVFSAGTQITRGDMANILFAINYKSYHEMESWLIGDAADTMKDYEDSNESVSESTPESTPAPVVNNTPVNTQPAQPQYSGFSVPANSAQSFRYMVEHLDQMQPAAVAAVLGSLNSDQQLQLSIYSAFANWAHYVGCQANPNLVVMINYGPTDCNTTAMGWQNTLQFTGSWDQALWEARQQQGTLLIGMKCATGELAASSCGAYGGLMNSYNNLSQNINTGILNSMPGGCDAPGTYLPDGSYCAPAY